MTFIALLPRRCVFFPRRILQQLRIYVLRWYLNITNDTASNKTILECDQLGIFFRIDHLDIQQFNVQILVDTMECSSKHDIVFEFDGNLFAHQGFEKT